MNCEITAGSYLGNWGLDCPQVSAGRVMAKVFYPSSDNFDQFDGGSSSLMVIVGH